MTKTITLPVETYQKMKHNFSFCEDYAEDMNNYLTNYDHTGFTKNQMISNILNWHFDDWFTENWGNGRFEGYEEEGIPVPSAEEMEKFFDFLQETYTLCPTWKHIKSTNKLKFIISRNVGSYDFPEYEPVRVRASGGREKELNQ